MSDVGVSDLTPRIGHTTRTFDRLLPRGGIETERRGTHVSYKLLHIDINDVGPAVQEEIGKTFRKDFDQYGISIEHIPIGTQIGRQFRVYDIKDSNIFALRSFYEMLDNPHGYGIGDFLIMNYVLPEFHRSRYLRAGASDLFHVAFKTGLMKRIYGYLKVDESIQGETNPWKMIDEKASHCIGRLTPGHGPDIQKYIGVSRTLDTSKGRYAIFEVNGEIYNGMDLRAYNISAMEGTTGGWENLDDLLGRLDEHAAAVKKTAKFDFVRRRRD